MDSKDEAVKKLKMEKSIDDKIAELTPDEREVYDKAVEQFAKGLTYEHYTKREAYKIRDYLQKDFGIVCVDSYRRRKHRSYKSDGSKF